MLTQHSQNTNTTPKKIKEGLNTSVLKDIQVVETKIWGNQTSVRESDKWADTDKFIKLIFDLKTDSEYDQWCKENWFVFNVEAHVWVEDESKKPQVIKGDFGQQFIKIGSKWERVDKDCPIPEYTAEKIRKDFRKNIVIKGSWVRPGGMEEDQYGNWNMVPGWQDHQLDSENAQKKLNAYFDYERRATEYEKLSKDDNLGDWIGFEGRESYRLDGGIGALAHRLKEEQDYVCYLNPNTLNYGTEARDLFNFQDQEIYALFFEHDDKDRTWQQKLSTFDELGFPKPTMVVWTGNKSVHFIYTFDRESRPTPEQARDLAEQINRQGGFDGWEQGKSNPFKNFRIPGQKHSKSGLKTTVKDWGTPYEYEELRAFFHAPERELGQVKKDAKQRIGSVPAYSEILNRSSWVENFYQHGEYEAEQAEKKKEREKFAQKAKQRREEIYAKAQRLFDPVKVTNTKVKNGQIDLRAIQSKERREELIAGTRDGHGRWKSTYYFINTLVELEHLAKERGLTPIESSSEIFQQYLDATYSSIGDEKERYENFLATFERKLANPTPDENDEYFQWKQQSIQRWIDKNYERVILQEIHQFIHGVDVCSLILSSVDEEINTNKDLELSQTPILFDDKKISWEQIVEDVQNSKCVAATKELSTALGIIENGGWIAFIPDSTKNEHLHKVNGLMIKANLAYLVGSDENFLAIKLRSGFASQGYDKQHKPSVLTLDENGNRWGFNYHKSFIENDVTKCLELGKLNGVVGDIKHVSELVEAHHSKIKSSKLIAIKSGTGTGKTFAASNIIGKDLLKICLTHSEQLAKQDAKRFGVKSYKKVPTLKNLTEEEKKEVKDNRHTRYEESKTQGLSITINTLTESALGKGYLGSVFKFEDWQNTLLIVDEIESFLTACLESGTINRTRHIALEQFKNLVQHVVRNGGQVLIMDAHLRYRSIKLIEQFIAEAFDRIYNEENKHNEYRAFTICNNYKRLNGRKINVYENSSSVVSAGINIAKDGGKVIQFTDVKGASGRNFFSANALGKWLKTQPLKSFIISADTKTLTDDDDFGFVDEIEEFVKITNNFYGVITPTISSGTDWNNFGLNAILGVYSGVTNLDANLQQLDRIRDHSPRHLYFPSRSAGNYDKDFVENYNSEIFERLTSYAANVGGAYMETLIKFHGMTPQAAHEHLATKFPETDKRWIEYWQNLQLEQIFECEEFKFNHIARLADDGCEVSLVNYPVDKALIAELKEFGNEEKEKDLRNVSEADIDLETDDNAETYTTSESYTIRLNSVTRFAGISSSQWMFINESNDMKYQIVERFSGRQAFRKREGLQLRFAIMKYMQGLDGDFEAEQLSKDILLSVDLRSLGTSHTKCRKDIQRDISSKFNFLVKDLNIVQILKNIVLEGIRLGVDPLESIGSFHNKMSWVNFAHKILMEHREFVKKNFGIIIDIRPDRAASNIKKIIAYLGFACESKKVRDKKAGSDNKTNAGKGCNLFVIRHDAVSDQMLAIYDENWKYKNSDTLASRFNPDATVSGFWRTLVGILPKTDEEYYKWAKQCEVQFEREYKSWDERWVPPYLRETYEIRLEADKTKTFMSSVI